MFRESLNSQWALREAPLNWKRDKAAYVAQSEGDWFTDLSLPCDVHMPLIAAGLIKDPVLAAYSFDSEWIEQRSWWFKRIFQPPEDFARFDTAELVLESLDVHADVFINGAWIGYHASTHYPFIHDIKSFLRPGDNELLIRLTSGLETVSDADLAEIDFAVCTEASNGCPERGDKRRAFVRKPTYVYGWDWCPRIGTCGITKDAYIEYHQTTAVREVHVTTRSISVGEVKQATLSIETCVELLDIVGSADADIEIVVSRNGRPVTELKDCDQLLRSGLNYLTYEVAVEDAQLWWPNGMGEQALYDLQVSVNCKGTRSSWPAFAFGIRTIRLDTGRQDAENRLFALIVNGLPIFCKGGDWIPADSIYARVSDEKYVRLIDEACAANFNMLRIWGGGIYERDVFYKACDQRGILLWHDMMFGCSTYPDHLEPFRDLVSRELDYQTKRLRNHASLALFCGNNENHWIFTGPSFSDTVNLEHEKQYGLLISNSMLPETIRKNCPAIPYWNSSPYGGQTPNSPHVGDVHHWHECMMNPEIEKRIDPLEYDLVQARFVSEYGYPGPCPKQSISTYFDDQAIDRSSRVWQLHNNTFEKFTVNAGIKKHYTERELDLDEYILYAGMVQSLMLGYSLEALRFKQFCHGGLFWMYNDCWGEVGWTIIDYYLRRKISFYGVRRAFAPCRLILREVAGEIVVMGCNDTAEKLDFDMAYGYVRYDGSGLTQQTVRVSLPASGRCELLRFARTGNPQLGVCFARPVDRPAMIPGLLRDFDIRQTQLGTPQVEIISETNDGQDLLVTVRATTFCHGVYLDTGAEAMLSDNYFDLLPGEERVIRVIGSAGRQHELKTIPVY